jgi:predicted Zn-ribbon and HTH transcriptional regulator
VRSRRPVNFQILLEMEQSILRKNTIASLEHGGETGRHPNTPTHNQIDFLLCPSCYWCASHFNYSKVATRCPTCSSDNVESMPISNDELYTFGHDGNRGVTLEFSKSRGIVK